MSASIPGQYMVVWDRCLIFSMPYMIIVQVAKCSFPGLRGYTLCLLSVIFHSLQLTHTWYARNGVLCRKLLGTFSGQPLRVNMYMVLWMGSLSIPPMTMFNLPCVKCMLCTFWSNSIGMFLFVMGIA